MKNKLNSLRGKILNSYTLRNKLNPYIFFITLFFTNFVYSQALGSVTFGNIDENAKTIEINYQTDVELAGFQLDFSGIDIDYLAGGDAQANGFTISANGSTVLGFSFTGAVILPGSGLLTIIHYESIDSEGSCFVDARLSPVGGGYICGNPDGSSPCNEGDCIGPCPDEDGDDICDDVDDCVGELDECGVCNGDGSTCPLFEFTGQVVLTGDSNYGLCGLAGEFYPDAIAYQNLVYEDCGQSSTATSSDGTVLALGGFDLTSFACLDVGQYGGDTRVYSDGTANFSGSNEATFSNISMGMDVFYDTNTMEGSGSAIIASSSVDGLDNGTGRVLFTYTGSNYVVQGECGFYDMVVQVWPGEACDDIDQDGVCDDVDDCIGQLDECGVCNGDGIADGTC